MFWLAVACLNQFINSLVWHGNVHNSAPVWCDISSRLIVGISVAIPASAFCIIRRLYKISVAESVVNPRKKLKAMLEDISICLGIPISQMIIQYTVSEHRFNIYEGIGCSPATYNIWPAYIATFSWPLLVGLACTVFGVSTLRVLVKKQQQMKDVFLNPYMPRNQFNCLIVLSFANICLITAFGIAIIAINASLSKVYPFKGWTDTHSHYADVGQIPANVWRSDHGSVLGLELFRWSNIIYAVVFFLILGCFGEARRAYGDAFWVVSQCCGRRSKITTVNVRASSMNFEMERDVPQRPFRSSTPTLRGILVSQEIVMSRDSWISGKSHNFNTPSTAEPVLHSLPVRLKNAADECIQSSSTDDKDSVCDARDSMEHHAADA
ncbi:STE3-domain-containing protein [Rickenella mellea]|uniref:STE3-domain-containing protein n=1 Tax=Rickenella mellea TaxID=50990 RepID=A0A4Y7PQW1_9AGAM|nr:STE3-domain-containing protein [Rickenella mellea]